MRPCLHLLGAAVLLAATATAARGAPPAQPKSDVPVTRANVDARVDAIVKMIWSQQTEDGWWRNNSGDKNKTPSIADIGTSCLCLLALKVAGADEQEARFQKGLKVVLNFDIRETHGETYTRGLRATLVGHLNIASEPAAQRLLFNDAKALGNGIIVPKGMYTYQAYDKKGTGYTTGDFSNTQYGVLGVWAASDHGLEVPIKFWQLIEHGYVKAQAKDGAWPYYWNEGQQANTGYASMTAGGIASLFVVWDKLYVANDSRCRNRVSADLVNAIDRGLNWMKKNFTPNGNFGRDDNNGEHWNDGYTFYGIERVGVASGLKYFGKHDWYKEIAHALLNGQAKPYGLHQNAWTLMFLCYGRAPVAFDKLDYGRGWNEHPRDFAGLCKWLSGVYEHHTNWQIMPLSAGQDELHDAPILAMSGDGAFSLKPDDVAKIRTFLDRGGTLFGEAVGGAAAFNTGFATLCRQLYPQFELVKLDRDHPIYRAHYQFDGQQVPELMGVSDGVRTPIIFSPKDLSCSWQRMRVTEKDTFGLGDNLLQYASDGGQLWSKEESYWPADLGNKPDKTVTVGRLIHSVPAPVGNAPANPQKAAHLWNPSGGQGWVRLDILSRNGGGPAIATKATDLSEPLDPKAVPVLHVTGIGQLVLDDKAKTNLKAYVNGGGLLLADAAGGNKAFAESFGKLANDLFGQPLVPPPALPFTGEACEKDGKAWYRHVDKLPKALRPLQLQGLIVNDQWNVLLVPNDLTYALNGAPATDPVGLQPDSAQKLATAILRWRTGLGPAAAPPPAQGQNN
ncbi:MAG: hypothetical protein BIFFINMI_02229 [Phycisphaerae bacterium]|nr:hypothetical protein [Phycisphaerae bacterium]